MKPFLRNLAILFVGWNLALWTSVALGAIDARKLFILWAIFSGLLYVLATRVRARAPHAD
jgi:hypothetical protein